MSIIHTSLLLLPMRFILYSLFVFVFLFSSLSTVRAATLTEEQIQTILGMLSAFGVDSAIVSNVNSALRGQASTANTSSSSTGSAATCYTLTRDLNVGSSGEEVAILTRWIGPTTNNFTESTAAAVRTFQRAHGISPANGFVGPLTRAKLNALYGCSNAVASNTGVLAPSGTSAHSAAPNTTTAPSISSLSQSSATTRSVVSVYGTNLLNPRTGETTFVTFLKNGVELGGIPVDRSASTNTRLVFAIESYDLQRFSGATHLFVRHGGLSTSPKSNTVAFSVPAPVASVTPVISLSPTSTTIAFGGMATFTWSVTPSTGTSCQGAGTGIGNAGTSAINLYGTWTTPRLYANAQYGIKCVNGDKTTYKYADVTVTPQQSSTSASAPVITISSPAGDTSVAFGGKVTFSWNVSPATATCYAAGTGINGATGSGLVNASGSWTSPELYTSNTYGIRCTSGGASAEKYVRVTVASQTGSATTGGASASAPVVSSVSPTSAVVGTSATFVITGANFTSGSTLLYTNTANGYSGTLYPTYSSSGQLSITVTPSTAGTIIFSVKNTDGQVSGSATVTIASAQGASVWSAFKSLFTK
jgi:hypothetical protein